MKQRVFQEMYRLLIVIVIGVVYALWCRNTGVYVPCVFYEITGFKCPSCGITHMFMAIFTGDFIGGFNNNPVMFCMLPIIIFILGRMEYTYIRYNTRKSPFVDKVIQCVCICILLIYGVGRNLI